MKNGEFRKIEVSVVISVKEINDYLRQETIPAILKQTFQNFEIIVVVDKESPESFPRTRIVASWPKQGPADKRDIGAETALGDILAFLDDDSYPDENWLRNATQILKESNQFAGVCGPTLTPPNNNVYQEASGYVWSSWLGSGGAGTYRCQLSSRRGVDDYPAVNFLVKKKDFFKVGGFDSYFWPGEDTKLCFDLVYKLGKKIIYDPSILVYHHRRPVFIAHLRQVSRYAIHRGHFARILPKTSFRIGYFMPSFFVLGLVVGFLLWWTNLLSKLVYLGVIGVYLFALLVTAAEIYLKEKKCKLALLVIPSIFVTHVVYGFLFVKGFLSPRLNRGLREFLS